MPRSKTPTWKRFFRWVRDTLDMLCDRPDHLQRISIVGAGVSIYPAFFTIMGVLIAFAIWLPQAPSQIVEGLINFGYIFLALFALVIVSLLGTIKGLKIGPRGLEVTTIADDPDVDPNTSRGHDRGRGGYGGYRGFGPQDDDDCEPSFSRMSDALPEVDGADAAGDAIPDDKSPGRITP